ncbi:aromatic acid exporter family protein [Citricoccus sp. GCM10030269]|uniref:FUSC family protein n=1 Tax=Citricoccus sp. GCM10030269 TaxID=3273388 RepID=UPI00362225C4
MTTSKIEDSKELRSRHPWRRLIDVASRPGFSTGVLQVLKSVVAATGAWWFSVRVLGSPIPFLAPWVALLTVHATVYRSLSRGMQTTVASAIGVGLSFLIGNYLGVNVWTFALALLLGLIGARINWIREEGVAIATTAIFVLGSGFANQEPLLLSRLVEVAVGVGIGIAVNLLLIPPLRQQQASGYVDSINQRMGDVLVHIADETSTSWDTDKADAWLRETDAMSEEMHSAQQIVRFARESRLANPRAYLSRTRRPKPGTVPRSPAQLLLDYEQILVRLDEGISHLRHLTRTLREATYAEGTWDTQFREQWYGIVRDCGLLIADSNAAVDPIHDRLTALATTMSTNEDLPTSDWPVYGSLITSMRLIATIADDVAFSREPKAG